MSNDEARNNNGNRAEPSAPPIYMMAGPSSDEVRDSRDRSPPPRYEEAIAADLPTAYNSSASSTNQHEPMRQQPVAHSSSPLSNLTHRSNNSHGSTPSLNSHRHSSSRQRSNTPRVEDDQRSSGTGNTRYRSASPGDLSDSSHDRSGGSNELKKKKRSSGSKIKKGLENIAFFIIQILD